MFKSWTIIWCCYIYTHLLQNYLRVRLISLGAVGKSWKMGVRDSKVHNLKMLCMRKHDHGWHCKHIYFYLIACAQLIQDSCCCRSISSLYMWPRNPQLRKDCYIWTVSKGIKLEIKHIPYNFLLIQILKCQSLLHIFK